MDMIRKEAEVDSRALFCSLELRWSPNRVSWRRCGEPHNNSLKWEFLNSSGGGTTTTTTTTTRRESRSFLFFDISTEEEVRKQTKTDKKSRSIPRGRVGRAGVKLRLAEGGNRAGPFIGQEPEKSCDQVVLPGNCRGHDD